MAERKQREKGRTGNKNIFCKVLPQWPVCNQSLSPSIPFSKFAEAYSTRMIQSPPKHMRFGERTLVLTCNNQVLWISFCGQMVYMLPEAKTQRPYNRSAEFHAGCFLSCSAWLVGVRPSAACAWSFSISFILSKVAFKTFLFSRYESSSNVKPKVKHNHTKTKGIQGKIRVTAPLGEFVLLAFLAILILKIMKLLEKCWACQLRFCPRH